jgi:CheY-like chemotaxis protein
MAKILIIDEDPTIQEGYKRGLEKRGFVVSQAFDGQSGVETAKQENPDAILLDIMMPGMDGIAALQKLKQNEKTSEIPVMIITNFGQDENIRQALDLGVEEFILKYRATPDEVGEKINQVLTN